MPSRIRLNEAIAAVVRDEWGRILASLSKSFGDIQIAEDALQDAVVLAMQHWPEKGLPKVPSAWLITTARRRAIDRLRRVQNFASKSDEIAYLAALEAENSPQEEALSDIPDKRLEMIFTCCHPALEEKTRIALTLRTLGGLSTDAIAAAFLDKPEAMGQRLVRAKRKIKDAGIPYSVPERSEFPKRLAGVLRVIYLIFNEGWSPRATEDGTRGALSQEAIRLARIIHGLMPEEPEVAGLLALQLFHDARRKARLDADGMMISLEHQDRALWNKARIGEGDKLLRRALKQRSVGPYQLQAAISAVHATSPSWEAPDWPQIAGLYEALYRLEPTAVVRINQAVAVAYGYSVERGFTMLEAAAKDGDLTRYQPYHAARADLLLRMGKNAGAKEAFKQAIALSDNQPEKAFLTAKSALLGSDLSS